MIISLVVDYNKILRFVRFVDNDLRGSITIYGHISLGFFIL
jgi:hypothetical protein